MRANLSPQTRVNILQAMRARLYRRIDNAIIEADEGLENLDAGGKVKVGIWIEYQHDPSAVPRKK